MRVNYFKLPHQIIHIPCFKNYEKCPCYTDEQFMSGFQGVHNLIGKLTGGIHKYNSLISPILETGQKRHWLCTRTFVDSSCHKRPNVSKLSRSLPPCRIVRKHSLLPWTLAIYWVNSLVTVLFWEVQQAENILHHLLDITCAECFRYTGECIFWSDSSLHTMVLMCDRVSWCAASQNPIGMIC